MESQTSTNPRFPLPRRAATEPPALSQAPRRSFSLSSPPPCSSARSGGSKGSEDLVEILFNHPFVKIVAFTTNQRSSYALSDISTEPLPGSLPPLSKLERTIAIGMLTGTLPKNYYSLMLTSTYFRALPNLPRPRICSILKLRLSITTYSSEKSVLVY
jgi:hypothetical protein